MDQIDDSDSSSSKEEDKNFYTNGFIRKLSAVYKAMNLSTMVRQNIRQQLDSIGQLHPIDEERTCKSLDVAAELKEVGDVEFCKGKYDKAANAYTMLLSFLPEGSEDIGHAYANRSAALFKLGKYEQGVRDIDRALSCNYPEDKKQKLRERKERYLCSKLEAHERAPRNIESEKSSDDTEDDQDDDKSNREAMGKSVREAVELEWRELCNFKRNPLIPNASAKIKLACDEKWGRHLIATEEIKTGEVLSNQNLFTILLEMEDKYVMCAYCMALCSSLIPCQSCNLAMYCSESCRTAAFNSYHRIECALFHAKEVRANLCSTDHMALRMLLVGTNQGAGLATLMKKLTLSDIFAEKVDPTNKPFSADYVSVLRLRRTFNNEPQLQFKSKSIILIKIIMTLQELGYFDNDPDQQNREAHVDDAKDADKKNVKREKDDDKNDEDKVKVLDTVAPADESNDKKKDADVNEDEDKQILKEDEDSSRLADVLGNEFIKKVTCYYCELCEVCLCYNPEVSQDEVVRTHCRTSLHQERYFSNKSKKQRDVTDTVLFTDANSSRADEKPSSNVVTPGSGPDSWATRTLGNQFSTLRIDLDQPRMPELREYVTDTALFKNVKLCKTLENLRSNFTPQPGCSTWADAAPEEAACPVASDPNQVNDGPEPRTRLTETELFVALLLLNHMHTVMGNVVSLTQLFDHVGNQRTYATGVCPLHSMVNHSCNPNAFFIRHNNEHALVTSRMISKGEQIFVTYTQGYWNCPLDVRTQVLSNPDGYHRFVCQCEACVNKWPVHDSSVPYHPRFVDTKFSYRATQKKESEIGLHLPRRQFEIDNLNELDEKGMKKAMRVFYKVMLPVTRRKITSMSRREIIQVVLRICKWLHMNLEKPSIPFTFSECLVLRTIKHFYDNSSPEFMTELTKKEELQTMLLSAITYMKKS